MQKFQVKALVQSELEANQDGQGIVWQNSKERVKRRETRIKYFKEQQIFQCANDSNINTLRTSKWDCYQYRKFHQAKHLKLAHFQLSKGFLYSEFSNNLIFPYFNELNFYNPSSYEQQSWRLKEGFTVVGISQNQENLLLASLESQIAFFSLMDGKVQYEKVVNIENCIINQADYIDGDNILLSDNNYQIRIVNPDILQNPSFSHKCNHFVNYGIVQQKSLVVCQDHQIIPIIDITTGDVIHQLKGHQGYNFAAKFNPIRENELATSGEDGQCLIWDLRRVDIPSGSIKTIAKPFYNILYTKSGLLICVEGHDSIQIYNTSRPEKSQIIDFFGECIGCAAHSNLLHFGVSIQNCSGIFEFQYTAL